MTGGTHINTSTGPEQCQPRQQPKHQTTTACAPRKNRIRPIRRVGAPPSGCARNSNHLYTNPRNNSGSQKTLARQRRIVWFMCSGVNQPTSIYVITARKVKSEMSLSYHTTIVQACTTYLIGSVVCFMHEAREYNPPSKEGGGRAKAQCVMIFRQRESPSSLVPLPAKGLKCSQQETTPRLDGPTHWCHLTFEDRALVVDCLCSERRRV